MDAFLLEQAGPLVRATAGGSRAVIVTDTNVGPLYQMPVKQSLEASDYEVSICTFPAYEATSVSARERDYQEIKRRQLETRKAGLMKRLKGE